MPHRACVVCGVISNQARCEQHRINRNTSGRRIQALRKALINRDGDQCMICGGPGPYQVDHVIPLSDDGPDTLSNMRLLCATTCHRGAHRAH